MYKRQHSQWLPLHKECWFIMFWEGTTTIIKQLDYINILGTASLKKFGTVSNHWVWMFRMDIKLLICIFFIYHDLYSIECWVVVEDSWRHWKQWFMWMYLYIVWWKLSVFFLLVIGIFRNDIWWFVPVLPLNICCWHNVNLL